ncbi:MAG: threonine synthase [Lachnospiraceae bacterium]|nr:threonine synthase [Lachnospiraceae bacterium]
MRYMSTRSGDEFFSPSEAVLKGIAPDGGLFVPESVPKLPFAPGKCPDMTYRECAQQIMGLFLDDYTEDEMRSFVEEAYSDNFDDSRIVPFRKAGGAMFMELWHGPTMAFKDMALQILPRFMTAAAAKNGSDEETVILTATSGDTGKAALAGFADVPGTRIVVFYPKDGVSLVQERQMITQKGANTCVIGIKGNFDDAQKGVKTMFTDEGLNELLKGAGFRFSSANSINIGRLVPQIVYYVYAYQNMVNEGEIKAGDEINIAVPTGNFGNILAAYYARTIGLPVKNLICASNKNKVLYDFFRTGTYDRNREFYVTSSPSMDILVSSNLERLIYHICGGEDSHEKCASLMAGLSGSGRYSIDSSMEERLSMFCGGYADEEKTAAEIGRLFKESGYVADTHTAVASAVLKDYRDKSGDMTPAVIASTASPYKFAPAVVKAIDPGMFDEDPFVCVDNLAKISNLPVPRQIDEIRIPDIKHDRVCDPAEMDIEVKRFLGVL